MNKSVLVRAALLVLGATVICSPSCENPHHSTQITDRQRAERPSPGAPAELTEEERAYLVVAVRYTQGLFAQAQTIVDVMNRAGARQLTLEQVRKSFTQSRDVARELQVKIYESAPAPQTCLELHKKIGAVNHAYFPPLMRMLSNWDRLTPSAMEQESKRFGEAILLLNDAINYSTKLMRSLRTGK